MEKSKKIICIILVICALSALCAVGASALVPTMNYSYGPFDGSNYDPTNKQSDSLPLNFNSFGISYNNFIFTCKSDFISSMTFSVTFSFGTYRSDISNYHDYFQSLSCFFSDSNPTSLSVFTPCTPVSIQYILDSEVTNRSYYSVVCIYNISLSSDLSSGIYYFMLPQYSVYGTLNGLNYLSLSPSEPEPDPSIPSSGSSEGALLDGFTWAQNIGYYASFSPLLNSNTNDPVYMGVTRMSRLPYDQITDSKFLAPSSSNGCSLIMGQKTDYSDILVSGTVGFGVTAMLVTSPFKLDSSTLGVDYTAQIFFASGDDPSASGYTQVDVSSLGFEEFTVRVWTIDYNEWSKIVMCRYYFVLDLGVSTPSFPTDTISVQFKSTSVHTHEWYWTPFDFRFQYALRESESDPLPDSVTNYNPATGSPTSNGGYNTSGSTVTSELNEELTWANDELLKLTPMQQSVLDAAKFFYDDDGQMFQEITGSLESLYNSLSYTGVGGTLKFPRAIIPWGNSTLMLWPEQTIPFGEYINQIPTIYVTIISFLLVTGGWFAFVAISVKFFKRTFYGDVTSERF